MLAALDQAVLVSAEVPQEDEGSHLKLFRQ